MKSRILFFALLILMTATSSMCSIEKDVEEAAGNFLKMKINGEWWIADHDVFGAFHPKGYDKVIIIAGSKGPKDATEQAFNINLYQTEGTGEYAIATGNSALSVAQMGNWSAQSFLCGSLMKFDFKVTVTKVNKSPALVEAKFEGTLTCNTGEVLKVTEGSFYYSE